MKQLINYHPRDNNIIISHSSEQVNFPSSHLKDIQPVKSWKSLNTSAQYIQYQFPETVTYNGVFINRFNFYKCNIATSMDGSSWTVKAEIDNMTTDEIHDEQYMHRYIPLDGNEFKYIRLNIYAQVPLFEKDYFKLGNFLVGNFIDIMNPRSGFRVNYVNKTNIKEFDSGHISTNKIGRVRREFIGSFDKISMTEYNKIIQTNEPFVLYLEFNNDPSACYLVKDISPNNSLDYYLGHIINLSFNYTELV